jgi:large subunit ribosomal protein LP0
MSGKVSIKQQRKEKVWERTQECCDKFQKCMFVNVDNVTSKQICVMRKQFREIGAVMVMGKNTLMKKAIKEMQDADKEAGKNRPHLNIIRDALVLNTGIIFTDGDLAGVKAVLDKQVREAPAKVGMLAPADVEVKAGPTGMDPKQTSFFQALSIQTKIVKSQVEIVNPVKVIVEGEKITPGQAALLDKLKIRPFFYKMEILNILDHGEVYPAKVLSITTDSILKAFGEHSQNVAAVSLSAGIANQASVHHMMLNAFKHLACASMASGFGFKEADRLASAAASAPVAAAASSGAPAAAAKKEEKVEEPEDDVDMGDLFGGDY